MAAGPSLDPRDALAHWGRAGELRIAPDSGLINGTWLLLGDGEEPEAVLQWVNPIFDPLIHVDIEAVTTRLAAQGLTTPRLLRTLDGRLWIADDAAGCWRLQSFVPGVTRHRLDSPEQAAAAGDLVGRFHAALTGWSYTFRAPQRNVHDTPSRMAELQHALSYAGRHALSAEARELGESILGAWRRWLEDGTVELPERPCHGDLKVSNLRFSGDQEPVGICLVDLDTLGPQTLAAEMGDAWRSWCNPAGEDDPERVRFDFARFEASARAWSRHLDDLTPAEGEALVPGIERICLELAARFCADAVNNSYFLEDRDAFPEPGRHNLVRAASQRRLAELARAARSRCQALIEELFHGE